MGILVIIKQMLVIGILVMTGYTLYKLKIIDEPASKKISTLVIDVCNPALAISCIIQNRQTVEHRQIIVAGCIGIIIYVILIGLGIILPYILRIPQDDRKFYHMMTVYTNTGFIGIPLARAVLPAESMIYVIIFNVLFSLFFYTHGAYILRNRNNNMQSEKEKRKVNIGIISSVIAIALCWFNISLPDVIGDSIIYIANATTFLSMSVLGVSLAMVSPKDIFKGKMIYLYALIHLVIVPVIIGAVMKGSGVDKNMTEAFVLMTALPVANMPLILADKNGHDTTQLSQMILLTTVMSLVTVPLVMWTFI